MINRPNNWNDVQEFADRPKLPLDAYVGKVKKVAVQSFGDSQQLCILFDIAEGEYRGFFDREFKANTMQDKKWKGVLRVWIPKDDGSEQDEWTKSVFKGFVTSFEKSNPGYKWDWNEASLVGKMFGVLFRNEEWDYNGKTGWAVRPFRAISADRVREGDYTLPNDKPLKNKTESSYSDPYAMQTSNNSGFAELEDDDELPF